ncbi:MAG TPA: EscU/YscU/HrcU family type III secretion system export apparatus switch protein [Thermodesulfovibrio thiophilus]|uniref:EscU/YscU/HrcU family type III secretion system export apparatus switch protein n=1 Tax=Thermodesulfovibrio thiophilus TaxID=340095 RepID=UPI00041B2BDE|nr:EscU/YscU/HrcU family type III secretion system export apparatus switch protein [Thermodesulfovibrio thiophilus]HHW20734.1 flagellar biosynthesis protein FlhB [Thermodesulfovibrio thiophilus]HOA82808.1 EscU/YscU/HrcU family type III secretion system export apparatus switch protein [Thermodesulfovibrio thiophilus]HQA03818.1 EscU/YscU/HrcU family type III secretion system export apparatus switch protein [Thermodesulfovibrio thiophilus]HQD36475.1 EscU/YscU/HrcU family type III secretion system 
MTEESKKAVALRYEQKKDSAPKVVAKGRGWLADRIIELARQHGVPLKEDKTLVEVLSKLELSEEIPVELYKAVAEILVFVYQIKEKIK